MNIIEKVKSNFDYMVSCRRYLHEHPESSNKELATIDYVAARLKEAGIPYEIVENGGLFGFINKGKEGPCVLLRSDVDALEIEESPNNLAGPKACVSKVPGVSHTCGHDSHMAMLLEAALVLNEMKEDLPGSVVFMFERGEEGTGNVAFLFRYLQAHKDELPISVCYSCHTRWNLPVGKVCVQEGNLMSGVGSFRVTIKGAHGHGARPDQANNPLDCFCAIYSGMNNIRLRKTNPFTPLTFSVCEVSCGNRVNVIPAECFFQGTYRYFDLPTGQTYRENFKKLLDTECGYYGMPYELKEIPIYLPVANRKDTTALARRAVSHYLGEDVLADCEPWMASESFGSMMAQYPSVFAFVGIQNEELGSGSGHHTPEFDIDENAMIYGAAAEVAFVLQAMEEKPDFWQSFTPAFADCEDLIDYCSWNAIVDHP